MFLLSFSSHTRIFHSFGDITIAGKGMQIKTYSRHSLSSEGSLACHTYCLKLSSPRTRDTHAYRRAFGSEAVTTSYNNLDLLRLGFEHPTFRMRGERSNLLRHRRGLRSQVHVTNRIIIFIANALLFWRISRVSKLMTDHLISAFLMCDVPINIDKNKNIFVFNGLP